MDTLQQKALALHSAIKATNEAANNETKSSAGDKHETARAMMQLEQEKLNKQLKEINDQQEELLKINTSSIHTQVTKGSLVKTEQALIFIATGIGKLQINGMTVFVVSEQSPLGIALKHRKLKETAELNGVKYQIMDII